MKENVIRKRELITGICGWDLWINNAWPEEDEYDLSAHCFLFLWERSDRSYSIVFFFPSTGQALRLTTDPWIIKGILWKASLKERKKVIDRHNSFLFFIKCRSEITFFSFFMKRPSVFPFLISLNNLLCWPLSFNRSTVNIGRANTII